MTITTEHTDDPSPVWQRRTWQHVAELADLVGREAQTDDWRAAALRPESPARDRLLHEFLWYLEQEGFAVVRPLTLEDMDVFRRFEDTYNAVEALMMRTLDHLGPLADEGVGRDDWGTFWAHLELPEGGWVTRLAAFEHYVEVLLAPHDEWWPQGSGAPALAAGYTLDEQLHGVLSQNTDWVDRLNQAGFTFTVWDGFVRCWRTRHLADLLPGGNTLDAQAREAAQWAREAIADLAKLAPGDVELPEPRRRRQRRRAALSGGDVDTT